MNDHEFASIAEAALYLRVSPATLWRRYQTAGRLRTVSTCGGTRALRVADLERERRVDLGVAVLPDSERFNARLPR